MFYDAAMLRTPYTKFTGDKLHGHSPILTPVWVRLDAVCPRIPGAPHHVVADGVDMTGEVPGFVHGWFCTALGDWLAVVNYPLRFADPHAQPIQLSDQVIPGTAVRPRQHPTSSPTTPK